MAGVLATIMAGLSAFSVTLGASSRVLFALGRDGHFPEIFAWLNPRYRTPHIAHFLCAGLVTVLGSMEVVRFLAAASSFGYLIAIGIVNYAAIALRRSMLGLRRPFRVMLYPLIPILGIASSWFFVPILEPRSLVLGGGLTAVGCVVYLVRPENRAQLRGLSSYADKLRLRIKAFWRPDMQVLIIGGGIHGGNIAGRLLAKDEFRMVFRSSQYQITFIEEDEERCQELERRYNAPIFQGDGTKQEILEQVRLENIDVAIAASDDDDKNAIAALQAKRLGVERVIVVVRDPANVPLLEDAGVECISQPYATAAMVENYLDRPGVAELVEIESGVASLMDIVVPVGSQAVDRRIADIDIPDQCVVAAVIRDTKFVVPRGHTEIRAGDRVVLVGPSAAVKAAHQTFTEEGASA